MDVTEKLVKFYLTQTGDSPFEDWFDELRDRRIKEKILTRIARVRVGNFGDCTGVGEGVSELRIHFGPGYRLYFAQDGTEIVVLLLGGDKSTQEKDIKKAKEYWYDYQERKKTKNF